MFEKWVAGKKIHLFALGLYLPCLFFCFVRFHLEPSLMMRRSTYSWWLSHQKTEPEQSTPSQSTNSCYSRSGNPKSWRTRRWPLLWTASSRTPWHTPFLTTLTRWWYRQIRARWQVSSLMRLLMTYQRSRSVLLRHVSTSSCPGLEQIRTASSSHQHGFRRHAIPCQMLRYSLYLFQPMGFCRLPFCFLSSMPSFWFLQFYFRGLPD